MDRSGGLLPQKDDLGYPEVFVSSKDKASKVSRLLREGRIRKIGPRLYTTNLSEDPEKIVSRNLWHVVAALVPGAVICYRTAFEGKKSPDGSVFLSGTYDRNIHLPGLTLRQVRASGPQEGDTLFVGGLFMASRPRAFLENLALTKARGMVSRSVGRENVEHRLAELLRINGEDVLNSVRDQARKLAPVLGLDDEFRVLDRLIGALLRSQEGPDLTSPSAIAYARGEPYDPARIQTFDALRAALAVRVHRDRIDQIRLDGAFYNIAFFDAYFSNYIEGTEFEVDEALGIVFHHQIPQSRPEDAHDILGTWRVVSSLDEMGRIPRTFEEFILVLRRRHANILEGRPAESPGEFKDKPNRAGSTHFVHPDLVRGTLRGGFEFYQSLEHPFARALFMMFMIAEVHPFKDGNGRTARAMMNAELVGRGHRRLFIPSVFRNEYVGSLKRLTHHQDAGAFIRVMDYAQEFAHRIDFTDLAAARRVLEACHAFEDPSDEVKLKMPPAFDRDRTGPGR